MDEHIIMNQVWYMGGTVYTTRTTLLQRSFRPDLYIAHVFERSGWDSEDEVVSRKPFFTQEQAQEHIGKIVQVLIHHHYSLAEGLSRI